MGLISRILLIVTWFCCVSLYILVIGGVMSPLHEIALNMESVQQGPFAETYHRMIFIGTYLVPALLFMSPIVYWIVSNIRQESQEYAVPRQ